MLPEKPADDEEDTGIPQDSLICFATAQDDPEMYMYDPVDDEYYCWNMTTEVVEGEGEGRAGDKSKHSLWVPDVCTREGSTLSLFAALNEDPRDVFVRLWLQKKEAPAPAKKKKGAKQPSGDAAALDAAGYFKELGHIYRPFAFSLGSADDQEVLVLAVSALATPARGLPAIGQRVRGALFTGPPSVLGLGACRSPAQWTPRASSAGTRSSPPRSSPWTR